MGDIFILLLWGHYHFAMTASEKYLYNAVRIATRLYITIGDTLDTRQLLDISIEIKNLFKKNPKVLSKDLEKKFKYIEKEYEKLTKEATKKELTWKYDFNPKTPIKPQDPSFSNSLEFPKSPKP